MYATGWYAVQQYDVSHFRDAVILNLPYGER